MAGWPGAGSLHAVRLRLTRLAADGTPAVNAAGYLVTSALTKISFTPTKTEGDEVEQKNGAGAVCVYYKAPDSLKGLDVSLEMCQPDPQVEELLAGGTVISDSGTPIGYAAPEVGSDPNPYGVAVEFWTRAVIAGEPSGYIRWLLPRVRFVQDERTAENAAMLPAFSGVGYQNSGFGTGPTGDWAYTSNRLWQWAREATLPDETDGYVAITGP